METLSASLYLLIVEASGRIFPVHMLMSKWDTTSYALHTRRQMQWRRASERVGQLVAQFVGWLVCWLVGRSVERLVGFMRVYMQGT